MYLNLLCLLTGLFDNILLMFFSPNQCFASNYFILPTLAIMICISYYWFIWSSLIFTLLLSIIITEREREREREGGREREGERERERFIQIDIRIYFILTIRGILIPHIHSLSEITVSTTKRTRKIFLYPYYTT